MWPRCHEVPVQGLSCPRQTPPPQLQQHLHRVIFTANTSHLILNVVTSGGVTCTKKTKKTVKVEKGKSYSFKTNAGNKYGPNTKCNVAFKKMNGCKTMKLSCDEFNLGGGDSLRVQRGKKKQL